MKIVVRKRLPLVLYVPNRMLRGRLCTFLICEALRGDGILIDREQLAALLRQSAITTPNPAALSAVGATFEEGDTDED